MLLESVCRSSDKIAINDGATASTEALLTGEDRELKILIQHELSEIHEFARIGLVFQKVELRLAVSDERHNGTITFLEANTGAVERSFATCYLL